MAIRYYKSDGGVFAVIADSAMLTALRENFTSRPNAKKIVNRDGTLTTAGDLFFNLVPTGKLPVTIFTRGGVEQNAEGYIYITSYFPILTRREMTVHDGETVVETYATEEEGKTIRTSFRAYPYPSWDGPSPTFVCNEGECSTQTAPYGYSNTNYGSNVASVYNFGVLVSNDEMTDFSELWVISNAAYDGGIYAWIWDITVPRVLVTFFNGLPTTVIDDDYNPYEPGGDTGDDDTGGEGGDGDFTDDTEPIDIPDLPDETDVSAASTKFITLFSPSRGQLDNLANYMWGNGFDLDTFKKIFANPIDCILGLSIVPFAPAGNGSGVVTVGNISTGVSMDKCKQYKEIDCGSISVHKYWGAYLDYAPFTKAEIYLPFIGMRPVQIDDIMGKTVKVVYHIDVLSGACIAFVKCDNAVLYNFVGQCSESIPISSSDWTNVVNGALGVAGAIGSMVATGGASAPYAAGVLASSALNALKPNIERSGSLAGGASIMAIKKPYLVLTRPKQAVAKKQNKYAGFPTWITRKLSTVAGYTKVEQIILSSTHATEEECSEIERLLKEGVYL